MEWGGFLGRDNIYDLYIFGFELLALGVLALILTMFTFSSKELYTSKEQLEDKKSAIKALSEDYHFRYGDDIHGSDVVAFILKNNAEYDYYFDFLDGSQVEITAEQVEALYRAGESFSFLWSQDYLTNTVLKDRIYDEYLVRCEEGDDHRLDYYIEQKGG